MADIDKDGFKEVIMASGSGGYLYVISSKGLLKWSRQQADSIYSSPAVCDINNDGKLEIFVNAYNANAKGVLGFDCNGNPLPQFQDMPIDKWTTSSIGDINKDGKVEILNVSGGVIRVLDNSGKMMPGWPKALEATEASFSSPAIGDIDGDGLPEVIIGLNGTVYVFNNEGVPLHGWPVTLPGAMIGGPCEIGDVDGDGRAEIVVCGVTDDGMGNIYIIENEGSIAAGLQENMDDCWFQSSSPALADLDGDGRLDIIAASFHSLYAWYDDGTPFEGFPKKLVDLEGYDSMILGGVLTPVVGDINGDGSPEIVVASIDGRVFAYGGFSKRDAISAGWPMFHYDLQRTGAAKTLSATAGTSALEAPSDLKATSVSYEEIELAWTDNSKSEKGFKVERKTGDAGAYEIVATLKANAKKYKNTGLAQDTDYTYRVCAYDDTGDSGYSNELSVTTISWALAGVTASTPSSSEIDLAWKYSSKDVTSFMIERKIGDGGTYETIAKPKSGAKKYKDTGLAGNTAYYYTVCAVTKAGDLDYSNEVKVVTMSAPSNLAVNNVSSAGLDISWTDNSMDETGFLVERKKGTGSYKEVGKTDKDSTVYKDTGLAEDAAYSYRIRAYNDTGYSDYSVKFDVAGWLIAPTGLAASAPSSKEVDLRWSTTSKKQTGFEIERKTGIEGAYSVIGKTDDKVTEYKDTAVAGNNEYYYRIRAIGKDSNSAYSEEASIKTLSAPSELSVTALSATQMSLAWTDNSTGEKGFSIERKTEGGIGYEVIATVGSNMTTYKDKTGIGGATYYYRIRAFTDIAYSDYLSEGSATAVLPPPSKLVAKTVSATEISLSWNDNSTTETGFKIERRAGAESSYVEIARIGADKVAYNDAGLIDGTKYSYRVCAYNDARDSNYSNEVNAITTLPAPSGFTAKTIS
ncbi:MAG: fibronectin type III domain-containing protein, partial [Candidatus Omnitrophica bacterium]|nr:fibronectin type III domain-containing protein [Candidatus Omnitrophota bacterium]